MSSEKGASEAGGLGGNGDPSLQFVLYPDRSHMMHLLQKSLKPLRPRLVAPPKKAWPPGSKRLDPPSSAEKKCRIEPLCRQGVWSYEMVPKNLSSTAPTPRHHVYYFAGGSFQNVPSGEHWKTVAELSLRLQKDDIRTHIVSPPLAPNSPAKDSLRMLRSWLEDLLEETHRGGRTLALAGDSSGGNLATTLAMGACGSWSKPAAPDSLGANGAVDGEVEGVDEHGPRLSEPAEDLQSRIGLASTQSRLAAEAAHDEDDPMVQGRSPFVSSLAHVVAICPVVDMRNIHPDIPGVGAKDPMLTPEFTGAVAECWRGAVDVTSHPGNWHAHVPITSETPERMAKVMAASDPRISPLLADVSVLRECEVTIDGLIAGLDTLSPDALEFVDRLKEARVSGEWQLWENMMHCWPLTWSSGIADGTSALAWIERRLRAGSKLKTASPTTE